MPVAGERNGGRAAGGRAVCRAARQRGTLPGEFHCSAALEDGSYEIVVAAGNEAVAAGSGGGEESSAAPILRPPGGAPQGDGSRENPWDLKTALAPAPAVRPGDTIWLRGGTYGDGSHYLREPPGGYGAEGQSRCGRRRASAPPSTEALPSLALTRGIGGLRLPIPTPTAAPRATSPSASILTTAAPGVKLINLVLHDCNQGVGFWTPAENAESYGNIIYYNG